MGAGPDPPSAWEWWGAAQCLRIDAMSKVLTPCRSARRSASPSPAASTPRSRWPGCARRAPCPAPTPPTSASTTSRTSTRCRTGRGLRRRDRPAGRLPRGSWSRRAWSALQCGAFHIRPAGRTYFNTTPLGRAVTGTLLVRAMPDDGVDIWGDGSTYKGNDIERFYRYGLLANPRPAHLQAVAGRGVRRRARRPRRDEPVARSRTACPTGTARRRRTRPTPTSGAPPTRRRRWSTSTRRWRSSSRSWASRTGMPTVGDRPRGRHGRASSRAGRSRSTARSSTTAVDLVREANAIGGRHGLGMSDQIENRIIEAKSRGIYEAPGMALLYIAYERLVSAIHNEDTIDELPRRGPPPRPAAVRGPLARPAVADAARVPAALGRVRGDRRGDAPAAAR